MTMQGVWRRTALPVKFTTLLLAVSLLAACETRTQSATDADSSATTVEQASREPGPADARSDLARSGDTDVTQEDLDVSVGSLIYFDYDSYDLKAEARTQAERWAEWLQQHPSAVVTIEGHCDERGTREYNLGLGERRAAATRGYLIALGVNANRLGTLSYGKERPACAGSTEDCWSQNRRAHMIVN